MRNPTLRYPVNGEMLTVMEMSRRSGIHKSTIYTRLAGGMSPEDAMKRHPTHNVPAAQAGKAASPWSRGPHADTANARRSWARLKEEG